MASVPIPSILRAWSSGLQASSQSEVPHAQLASLGALPFVAVQVGTTLQPVVVVDVSRKSPVEVASQSEVPQA